MASAPEAITDALPALYQDLGRHHLVPLWKIASRLLPHEPQPQAIPYLWRWADLAPLAHRSAKLVPIERGGERRVIAFMNPGLGGKWAATSTLWAGVQILLPGETAPAHRHSPAAIRFIIQGKGAYTTVEGDQCFMSPGDLVLTPPWTWHDHGNDSDEPVLPTMACWLKLLRPGVHTKVHRQTNSAVYHVFRGEGYPGHQWRALRLEDRRLLRRAAMGLEGTQTCRSR